MGKPPSTYETRTKLVCTIGPASESEECIRALCLAGMNIARINFSHCPYDEALTRIKNLRKVRTELNIPLGIMLDTKGPEVRIFGYPHKYPLAAGDILVLQSETDASAERPEKHMLTNLPDIASLCHAGQRVLLQDGFIEAEVIEVCNHSKNTVRLRINTAGILKENAHLAIPSADYPIAFMSEKDRSDIRFAVENDFEFIALSFVRKPENLNEVRTLIQAINPNSGVKLIAKIEDKQALEHLDDIIAGSDSVMIARGDLGVEVPIEELPVIQKKTIEKCYLSGRPVIVATQMLESMIENAYPTRAEVTDVANAVHDLTSAVMLSGETAQGNHPVRVVDMMRKIIVQAEQNINYYRSVRTNRDFIDRENLTNVISYNAISTAHHCHAKAIIVITASGFSARSVSKFRPGTPIHAFTFNQDVYHQLALSWGVFPHFVPLDKRGFGQLLQHIVDICRAEQIAADGDRLVFVAGVPLGTEQSTNMIFVETVGTHKMATYFSTSNLHALS